MKKLIVLGLIILAFKSHASPLIDTVRVLSGTSVGKYEKLEIGIVSLSISPNVYNVFDSVDVDMYAIFTSPTGKKYRRNAFWMTGREAVGH